MAFPADKGTLSTKLSTDFVDSLKSSYKTDTYRNLSRGARISGRELKKSLMQAKKLPWLERLHASYAQNKASVDGTKDLSLFIFADRGRF